MRVRIRRFGRLSDRRHHWYALVIPRKHVISIYELSIDEQSAVWGLVAEVAADRPETGRLQYRRERWFPCTVVRARSATGKRGSHYFTLNKATGTEALMRVTGSWGSLRQPPPPTWSQPIRTKNPEGCFYPSKTTSAR